MTSAKRIKLGIKLRGEVMKKQFPPQLSVQKKKKVIKLKYSVKMSLLLFFTRRLKLEIAFGYL